MNADVVFRFMFTCKTGVVTKLSVGIMGAWSSSYLFRIFDAIVDE